jgi:hypothetical protein
MKPISIYSIYDESKSFQIDLQIIHLNLKFDNNFFYANLAIQRKTFLKLLLKKNQNFFSPSHLKKLSYQQILPVKIN